MPAFRRTLFDETHEQFRASVRRFVEDRVAPNLADWEHNGRTGRDFYRRAGEIGLLGPDVDESYGGGGVPDFRFNVVIIEELCRVGAASVTMNISGFNDLVAPYLSSLGTADQKRRWLPSLCSGETIAAIALTEPDAGSDLANLRTKAERVAGGYLLNGSKTFISNGFQADVILVAARTTPDTGARGISLFVLERSMAGVERHGPLRKIGLPAQDTAELTFDDVLVPDSNLLGEVNSGFAALKRNLPRERLAVSVTAMASMRRTFDLTVEHVSNRRMFGGRLADLQATRFTVADLMTGIEAAQVLLDRCVTDAVDGRLTDVGAAMAKLHVTELQQTVVDRCLQLHGGYGYMLEQPVARDFLDARVSTIYAGASEVMKEIIGRDIIGRPGTQAVPSGSDESSPLTPPEST